MASPGTVYLLRHGDTRIYKIGRTRNPTNRRKRALTTGNPEQLHAVAEWSVPDRHGEFERLLHLTYADRRVRDADATEFFNFGHVGEAALVAEIDLARDAFLKRLLLLRDADAEQETTELVEATDEIDGLVTEHYRLQRQIKLLQMRCADNDAKLKGLIKGNGGVRRASRQRPLVTWNTTSSTRFDVQRFKEAHPELHAKFCTQITFRTFRVHE
jgi:hypothetical protein